jgi:hypothetical protein
MTTGWCSSRVCRWRSTSRTISTPLQRCSGRARSGPHTTWCSRTPPLLSSRGSRRPALAAVNSSSTWTWSTEVLRAHDCNPGIEAFTHQFCNQGWQVTCRTAGRDEGKVIPDHPVHAVKYNDVTKVTIVHLRLRIRPVQNFKMTFRVHSILEKKTRSPFQS